MSRPYSYPEFYLKTFSNIIDDAPSIQNFVAQCPDGPILEIGGGSGRTLGFFTSKTHVLLESDPEMLAVLEEKAKAYPNARVVQGRCPVISTPSETFGGVFAAFGTIGEINPICVTLQEIERVLVPGGYALLSALNPDQYTSPSTGIYRTASMGLKDFSLVFNTLPVTSLGTGEYQTQIWLRQPGLDQHFTIRQYFPNLEQWIHMIEQAGLSLEMDRSKLAESVVFSFLLKKPLSKSNINKKTVATVYDSIAPKYDQFISNAEYGLRDWITSYMDRLIGINPRFIDLACGNGYIGKLLTEKRIQCSELLGYDISPSMVSECTLSNLYTRACQFDLSFGLPGVAGLTTDVVTAFGLMEFLADPTPIIGDIRRILVLGGELFCSFEAVPLDSAEDQVEIYFRGQTLVRYRRSEKSVENYLRDAGFSKISIERRQGYRSPTTGESVAYLFVHALRETL